MNTQRPVAVLGAGAWGSVFAQILVDAGQSVQIWARRAELAAEINKGRNSKYVPGLRLSGMRASSSISEVVARAKMIVVAVPSHTVTTVLETIRGEIALDATLVSLVKGLQVGTLRFMTEVIADAAGVNPARVVAISGPNLSSEIAQHEPAGAVVAGLDWRRSSQVASLVHTDYFRPYVGADVLGIEISGVVKNVIALAVGASDGLGLGINTRAFLISRGLAEMARLGVALGGQAETFLGLAGLGDLVATCSSASSRNYQCGFRIAQGIPLSEALALSSGIVEGVRAAPLVAELAAKNRVPMPIVNVVDKVLQGKMTIAQARIRLTEGPRTEDGIGTQTV